MLEWAPVWCNSWFITSSLMSHFQCCHWMTYQFSDWTRAWVLRLVRHAKSFSNFMFFDSILIETSCNCLISCHEGLSCFSEFNFIQTNCGTSRVILASDRYKSFSKLHSPHHCQYHWLHKIFGVVAIRITFLFKNLYLLEILNLEHPNSNKTCVWICSTPMS